MDDWDGYTLGWLVTAAGGWLWMSQPKFLWLAIPIMLLGLGILYQASRNSIESARNRWERTFTEQYRLAVIKLKNILGPAQARLRGKDGDMWDEVKWLASDSQSPITSLIQSLSQSERQAVFEATTSIQWVYREWSGLISRRWGNFRKWFNEVWDDHDEILRLWVRIERARNPEADFRPYKALLSYRCVTLARPLATPPRKLLPDPPQEDLEDDHEETSEA